MPKLEFETVDVFTDRRFGGNPLAVFPDARGLSADEMQSLAAELNLSETTFVLPAENPENTVRIRIFNRTTEMAFAGHPSIGTGYVLARRGEPAAVPMLFEVPAGIVRVDVQTDEAGTVRGGRLESSRPLSLGNEIPVYEVAECLGLLSGDIVVSTHQPMIASVGNPYVIAEVHASALARCQPDLAAFRRAQLRNAEMAGATQSTSMSVKPTRCARGCSPLLRAPGRTPPPAVQTRRWRA